jgi:DNA invertase Pin-like site-specific DNA recombinase
MKITAIYCRTSTNKQDKGLESQVRYLSEYCNQKGVSNFLTYTDFGVSGKKSSRPGLNQLLSHTAAIGGGSLASGGLGIAGGGSS